MKSIRLILAALCLSLALPVDLGAQEADVWFGFLDNPNRETNGVYGFSTGDPSAVTTKKTAPELYFARGMGYQNGIIYGMDYKQGFFTPDRYILYCIDTKDWTVTQKDVDKKFALKETANGMDGTVYALFDDGVLGTLDYATMTRSDIYTPQRNFIALGVTAVGELYGIDSDLNLVSINTANGAETVTGKINLSIYTSSKMTGEINPVTGQFLLAAQGSWSEANSIYSIDLGTREVTTLGQLPPGYDYITGMIVVGEPAASGAPGKATDLRAAFEGNSLSGTFSFTAPTQTFDRQPLEGEMSYTVTYGTDGQQQLTGTATAGQTVTLPVTLTEGGMTTFTVKLANGAGEGQSASISQWIGPDAPLAPENVEFTLSESGLASLSWTAPTACVNGGYLGAITYDVYRIVSGEETLVAAGISTTSFSEQLEITTLKEYAYAVVASNEGTLSDRSLSNKIVAGDGFGVPFVEQFGEGNHLEYFTVLNVNGDSDRWGELTWKLHTQMTYWGSGDSYEEMWVQTDGATDDWLFTPPVQLKPNNAYVLKFKMKTSNSTEKFEVMMGGTATIDGMTTTLLPEQTITNGDYREFVREFTVDEAASYCFGFHATPNLGTALYLDDIEIRISASQEAPARVENLVATADAEGLLKAVISFDAPTKTIGGDNLTSLTKIEVLRDETLIATLSAPTPGAALQVTDDSPVNGYNRYAVIAYNDEGNGLRAETEPLYVGVDIPQAPQLVSISDNGQQVHFVWNESPSTGANGFVVRPESVTYEVYATDAAGQQADLLYEGKERQLDATYTDTEAFDIAKWIIVAKNEAGSSAAGAAKIATGRPLTLPYRETFAMGKLKNSIWTEQSGLRSFNPSTEDAAGEDAGSILFVPYLDGDRSSYNTQRLTFVGVKQPQLTFFSKLEGGQLTVKAWQPDGTETVLATVQPTGEWQQTTADMTMLKQQTYVVVKFVAEGEAGKRMFVDDVTILDGAYSSGISNVTAESKGDGQLFDLQGRRVTHPTKGLYVADGKKIFIR